METILGKVKAYKSVKQFENETLKQRFEERLLHKMQGLIIDRKQSNITINQMAAMCEVSRSKIIRFENYGVDAYLVYCYTNILKKHISRTHV